MSEPATAHDGRVRHLVLATVAAFSVAHVASRVVSVWLSTGLAALFALAWVWRWHRPALRDGFQDRPAWAWEIVEGVVCGVAMTVATHVVWALVAPEWPWLVGEITALYGTLHDPPGPLVALPLLVLVVVVEEFVWRGVAVPRLELRRGKLTALWLATLLYAVPQLFAQSPLLALVALGCGAIWTAQRLWRDSVWVPLVTHLTWDIGVFVIAPLL